MKKINYRKYLSIVLLLTTVPLLLFLYSCSCDEKVYMAVMAGARFNKDCENIKEMAEKDLLPKVTYVCKGDTVTICWGGNVASNKIEPGIGMVGAFGSKQIVVTESMTIKIIPQGDCAGPREFKVEVISGETPSSWSARWSSRSDKKCEYLFFNISEYFMSRNIRVVAAEAKFNPNEATGLPCGFPPYLNGKNIDDLASSNVQLNKPFEKVPLPSPAPAVGNWIFAFNDLSCLKECKSEAVLPFELTLSCP